MQALAHMTRAHVAKAFAAWVEATQMSGFYRCAIAGPVLHCSSHIPYTLPSHGVLSKFEDFGSSSEASQAYQEWMGGTSVDALIPCSCCPTGSRLRCC